MTREEFKKLTKVDSVSESAWEIITIVYNFYDDDMDKYTFAELFKIGGMKLIIDMEKRAKRNMELWKRKNSLLIELAEINEELKGGSKI